MGLVVSEARIVLVAHCVELTVILVVELELGDT
jgi:hypothetical protein